MQLDFKPVTLAEIPLLQSYFIRGRSRLCDQTLGGAMMWRGHFHTRYALREGYLFLQSEHIPGEFAFMPPMGEGDRGLALLEEHIAESGAVRVFCGVGEEEKERILSFYPHLTATPTREWFDYLYHTESLATFRGKKLSGQRNHRNSFLKQHADWCFEELCEKNLPDARAFFFSYGEQVQKDSTYFETEQSIVREVLEHFEEYGFFGGLIRAEGQVVAMSVGEIVGDTLFVHIEKASRNVRGAYPMMVSEFLRRFGEGVPFVNREEDMGDTGLRYSKESYHPCRLLEKYVLR